MHKLRLQRVQKSTSTKINHSYFLSDTKLIYNWDMSTKRFDQLSEDERKMILNQPGGLDRLIKFQEKHRDSLKFQVQHILTEIRDKEAISVSWISLIIVLGLLQVFQINSGYERQYILLCIPSFFVAFISTALTLQKHPNYIVSDFFTVEDEDKRLRYESCEAEIVALTKVFVSLHANYRRKIKVSRFIGTAVIVNFFMNMIFLISSVFIPKTLTMQLAAIFGILSLIITFFYSQKMTKSESTTFNKNLDK